MLTNEVVRAASGASQKDDVSVLVGIQIRPRISNAPANLTEIFYVWPMWEKVTLAGCQSPGDP
eukprot:scaffold7306_cov75-Cylindrotheca_fusiformis.AAC.1